MRKMLSHGIVTDDNWTLLDQPEGNLPSGNVLVPLSYWLQHRDDLAQKDLAQHNGSIGVWLDSHEEVEALAADLEKLPVIAINFPKFVDGRGFSSARLLRDRYAYQGEVRAIGQFIRDQLFLLQRCGFSQFSFADDLDLEAAAQSLNDFSDGYQTAADQAQPLFKRLRV